MGTLRSKSRNRFRGRPYFVIARGRWWIGYEALLEVDGRLINFLTLALFIPNDWLWRLRHGFRK